MNARLGVFVACTCLIQACHKEPAESPSGEPGLAESEQASTEQAASEQAASEQDADGVNHDSATSPAGGLGVTDSSKDESKIQLTILPEQMQVGDETFAVPHEDRLRRIPQIQSLLPPRLGLSAPDGSKMPMIDYDLSKIYNVRVDPEARGAEILSALQTAAFAGLPVFQVFGHSAVGYMRVPGVPGKDDGLSRLRTSTTPLIIVLTSTSVELWREAARTDQDAPKPPEKRATISLRKLHPELTSALNKECAENVLSCSPFFLNMKSDAAGKTLLAVLEIFGSRSEFSEPTSPPPRFLLWHGDVGKNPVSFRTIRLGATAVSGRLPAEVIQKVVREKFGEYRKCYEEGLARNSQLTGRVDVRFVIGRDGKVTNAAFAESSTVPDRAVSECVVASVKKLVFPKPEGGIVTVTYPILFAQD